MSIIIIFAVTILIVIEGNFQIGIGGKELDKEIETVYGVSSAQI